jgi:DAPG hydrolase PhiG domain
MSLQETVARINGRVTELVVKRSKGETKDLVIDHELLGVTPEMIDLWWVVMSDTDRYKLWHPRDHVWAELEVREEGEQTVFIQHVLEKVGGIPSLLNLRMEDPSTLSIPVFMDHAVGGSLLDSSGNKYAWTLHQYEEMAGGTRMRSTFRIPAKAPGFFVKGLRKHNIEEMGQFPKFLPELYQEITNQ